MEEELHTDDVTGRAALRLVPVVGAADVPTAPQRRDTFGRLCDEATAREVAAAEARTDSAALRSPHSSQAARVRRSVG